MIAAVDPETLPEMYADEMTVEQLNYVYMQQSEEWQHALDESRWAKVMIVAATADRDLAWHPFIQSYWNLKLCFETLRPTPIPVIFCLDFSALFQNNFIKMVLEE